jgi:hypothetical protein
MEEDDVERGKTAQSGERGQDFFLLLRRRWAGNDLWERG